MGEFYQSQPGRLPESYYVGKGPKGYRRTDERIQEEIWHLLMSEPHLDLAEIEVDVKAGSVVLTGTLPDRRMKHRIEDLAAGCWGVEDVRNDIRILKSLGPMLDRSRASTPKPV